jgi:hypothetical protein
MKMDWALKKNLVAAPESGREGRLEQKEEGFSANISAF